jgi:type IV pilus assembly protein PilB
VEAVLAQRLVRRICPQCRTAATPAPELLRQAGLDQGPAAARQFFHGRGCEHCTRTGYRGRMGIYEWLPMTEALRELVTEEAPALRMQQKARQEGVRSLRDDGLRAVFAGETTLEEILKYT